MLFTEESLKIHRDNTTDFVVVKTVGVNLNVISSYTPVSSFEEFCKVCGPNPIGALASFQANHVSWNTVFGKRKMSWPDDIIADRKGNCVDFAVFMHYFFEYHGIENVIGFTSFVDKISRQRKIGHAYPIFRMPNTPYYWIWNYFGEDEGYSDINGPFDDLMELIFQASNYYAVLYNSMTKVNLTNPFVRESFGTYLDNNDLTFLDQYFNNPNVYQNDLLLMSPKIIKLLEEVDEYASNSQNTIIDADVTFLVPQRKNIHNFFKSFNGLFKKGVTGRANKYW